MHQTVKFSKSDPQHFFRTLLKRVNGYFQENNIPKTGNAKMVIKTISILLMFLLPYALLLLQVTPNAFALLWYVLMGVAISGIGFSVMHDANHGAYSSKKWVNELLSQSMNLIGGNTFTWRVQHNTMHHTYTNIYELDEDIEDKPFLRLSPHGKYRSYHRFQHFYALFLYCFATISWITYKDFKQFAEYKKSGMTEKMNVNPTREFIILLVSKLFYYFYLAGIPLLMGVSWKIVVPGFIIMHLVSGLLITIVFQLAHVVEGPQHFTPEPSGTMENTWAIHQLSSTANFAPKNPLVTWFVGGLNFQIEHHLFLHICHIHYNKISKIVKETAREFGVPYYEFPHFHQAVVSHLKVLKELGNPALAKVPVNG
jgi:linoleoyl-CoA desaturase